MPTFVRRPSTMSLVFPVDFRRLLWLDSKDTKYRNCNSTSSLHFLHFCWKTRFKNQVATCSDFPSEAILWIKEVEMVDSMDELKSSRSIAGENFPNFEMLDARIASALNKIIQKFSLQEEGQSGGTESPERGPVSTRKTDRLHGLRLLSRYWRSWYSIGLRWFILCHSSRR